MFINDPALLLIEGLICNNRESELVGVKIERTVLVAHRNADEFDLLNHDALNVIWSALSRLEFTVCTREKLLSVYRYSANWPAPLRKQAGLIWAN